MALLPHRLVTGPAGRFLAAAPSSPGWLMARLFRTVSEETARCLYGTCVVQISIWETGDNKINFANLRLNLPPHTRSVGESWPLGLAPATRALALPQHARLRGCPRCSAPGCEPTCRGARVPRRTKYDTTYARGRSRLARDVKATAPACGTACFRAGDPALPIKRFRHLPHSWCLPHNPDTR